MFSLLGPVLAVQDSVQDIVHDAIQDSVKNAEQDSEQDARNKVREGKTKYLPLYELYIQKIIAPMDDKVTIYSV